mmetsp:Transcript_160425/g.307926  ORF Transcript_160425/g.307926 Transcript_160425/m.307926 type:complete len:512 (-) Transcript_160425:13-1548(-)
MDLQSNPLNEILYISFNQDFTCFVCGTETGFRVYSTDPFRLTHRRDFESAGGLGVIAMLFRTNILAFAGGGRIPRFQPHKVVLWDDRLARVIAELSFRSAVKAVRLRRDLVVVALEKKVYVYGFRSLSLFDSIETISNPKGLCCLSVGTERAVLVCPGAQKGRALVVFYPKAFGESPVPVERERTLIIAAHESPIAAMSTDYNGCFLATASDRGTIMRVYDTETGSRLQELRRGADRAEIHSLVFSPGGEWLAVSSDKGTVHIFSIQRSAPVVPAADSTPANTKSSLQRLSRVLPAYFASEWSLAQFRVSDYRCTAAFGADPHTVVVVCANGSYFKARFDPVRGGEMVREEFAQFDDESTQRVGSVGSIESSGSLPNAAAADAHAVGSMSAVSTAISDTTVRPVDVASSAQAMPEEGGSAAAPAQARGMDEQAPEGAASIATATTASATDPAASTEAAAVVGTANVSPDTEPAEAAAVESTREEVAPASNTATDEAVSTSLVETTDNEGVL